MNWSDENLLDLKINMLSFQPRPKNWAVIKNRELERVNNMCEFCGGKYNKYLYCALVDKESPRIFCRFCNIIANASYFLSQFENIIEIYWSELSQIEIIRKTVDFIFDNEISPSAEQIDQNVKKLPISILEYICIISERIKLPIEMNNYKIFFKNLDIGFINSMLDKSLFIASETSKSNNSNDIKSDTNIEKYVLTECERNFLNRCFNMKKKNNTIDKIDGIMIAMENRICADKISHQKTQFEFDTLRKPQMIRRLSMFFSR